MGELVRYTQATMQRNLIRLARLVRLPHRNSRRTKKGPDLSDLFLRFPDALSNQSMDRLYQGSDPKLLTR